MGSVLGAAARDAVRIAPTRRGRLALASRLASAVALAAAALVLAPIVLGIVPPPSLGGARPPADVAGNRAGGGTGNDRALPADATSGPHAAARRASAAPAPGAAVSGADRESVPGLPPMPPAGTRVDAQPIDPAAAKQRREERAAKPWRPEITRGDFPPPEELPPEERKGVGVFPPPGTSPP
ncbi:MAG TPA: hypothetical protein VFD84_00495, partial [Candidatus Binatia bacterium]|nr:hypothetical protein [Candidatus Binatia bacterium]